MPKGKGYTAKQIQAMRDEGVLSPSEIDAIQKGRLEGIRQREVLSNIPGVGKIVGKPLHLKQEQEEVGVKDTSTSLTILNV